MKNISKKFFALFAVLCMVLTMLPVQVFAAGKMYIDTPAAAVAPGHSIIIGLHNPKKNVKWTALTAFHGQMIVHVYTTN